MLLAAWGLIAAALVALGGLLFLALSPKTLKGDRIEASVPATTARQARPRPRPRAPQRLFAPTSVWNRPVVEEPTDPNSSALVQSLAAEAQRERAARIGPWIATAKASTPLYRVSRSQPTVRVRLDDVGTLGSSALRRALAAVPIPAGAQPAAGPDRHMTIWQPATDRLWELWQARRLADGWHARWGGAIRHVSKSVGYYTPAAWPGATRNWGATASSLPVIGGTITLDDLRLGRIRHALALALPAPRAGVFAWPAQRTDGTGPPPRFPRARVCAWTPR
jgi:hypothetical protein